MRYTTFTPSTNHSMYYSYVNITENSTPKSPKHKNNYLSTLQNKHIDLWALSPQLYSIYSYIKS